MKNYFQEREKFKGRREIAVRFNAVAQIDFVFEGMEKIQEKKSNDPELEIKFDKLYNRIPTAASDEEEDSESEYTFE
jgi:hypothetical protein